MWITFFAGLGHELWREHAGSPDSLESLEVKESLDKMGTMLENLLMEEEAVMEIQETDILV